MLRGLKPQDATDAGYWDKVPLSDKGRLASFFQSKFATTAVLGQIKRPFDCSPPILTVAQQVCACRGLLELRIFSVILLLVWLLSPFGRSPYRELRLHTTYREICY